MTPNAVAPPAERRLLAACRLVEALTALERRGTNLVSALVGNSAFVEQQHYPAEEIFDVTSGAQYYLHAHRGHGESGHIHCFLRAGAFQGRHRPRFCFGSAPSGITHVAALALDFNGRPSGLFTTNLWVTEDDWYAAEAIIDCLDALSWDRAPGLCEVNSALTALFCMYRPAVEALLLRRDAMLRQPGRLAYGRRALLDARLDVLSRTDIDLAQTLKEMRSQLPPATAPAAPPAPHS